MASDVLFFQNYSYVGDICAIGLSLTLLLIMSSSYTARRDNLYLFYVSSALVIISSISDIIFHRLVEMLSERTIFWVYVFYYIYYLLLVVLYAVFIIYLKDLVSMAKTTAKVLTIITWSGVALFIIGQAVFQSTSLGFRIDENFNIHQNYYTNLYTYAYIFYSILVVVVLVLYRERFISKMFTCLVGTIGVSGIMMIFETINRQTSYTVMTYTYPLVAVVCMFHYNSYDTNTGTLDISSYDSYIKNFEDSDFIIIFMYLEDLNYEVIPKISQRLVYFYEKFFKGYAAFRLRDEKIAIILDGDKNKNFKDNIMKIYKKFEKEYHTFKMDYKISIVYSDERIRDPQDYTRINEFLEEKMPVNSLYVCSKLDMDRFVERKDTIKVLKDIYEAQDLNDERVRVYCQPIFNTETGVYSSAEALIRIVMPDSRRIYPETFIPIAEQYGYVHILSKIMMNKICLFIKNTLGKGYYIDRIAINLSMLELRNEKIFNELFEIANSHGVSLSKLAIEYTESQTVENSDRAKTIMENVRALGVEQYLDNFGSGYSNLLKIVGLPFDVIKMDRSFVQLAYNSDKMKNLIRGFSDICVSSGFKVLFSGIENDEMEKMCLGMKASYLQGFKYSEPIPFAQLTDFFEKM